MPSLKTYDIFISHAWRYGSDYEHLVNLLDSALFFNYRNYSAPKDNPLYNLDSTDVSTKREIEQAIQRKIRPVNIVLVLSGMYYNYRHWMQYEIDTALSMNKPIIAIKPRGNLFIPSDISIAANTEVGWNSDSIVTAIRNYSI